MSDYSKWCPPALRAGSVEVGCRHACRQSLWDGWGRAGESSIERVRIAGVDSTWRMTSHSRADENALPSLVVRLCGVWKGDSNNERVQGCVGTLIAAILSALEQLKYTEFMQAHETVTLDQLKVAAMSASTNPDGYLDRWSEKEV
jgi:hypothetical protein